MEYLIGFALAGLVCGFAKVIGWDRERVFYPVVALVVATYYILFAVMASSPRTVVLETLVAGGFVVLGVVGFQRNVWLVVAALAGHGVFDFVHHLFIQNPGMPVWWPGFCGSFDVLAGGWLAWFVVVGRGEAEASRGLIVTSGRFQAE